MNDKDLAFTIAATERPHLGKPTTPPLAFRRLDDTHMIVILADGRKVIRKIPTSIPPSSVVRRPSSPTSEFKPVRKPSPPPTKKGNPSQ